MDSRKGWSHKFGLTAYSEPHVDQPVSLMRERKHFKLESQKMLKSILQIVRSQDTAVVNVLEDRVSHRMIRSMIGRRGTCIYRQNSKCSLQSLFILIFSFYTFRADFCASQATCFQRSRRYLSNPRFCSLCLRRLVQIPCWHRGP